MALTLSRPLPQARGPRSVARPSTRRPLRPLKTRLAAPRAALLRTRSAAPLWVYRPSLSVGYNMPLPRRRNMTPWGYTLPGHVRGAFMRTLSGILLRQGRSRSCLRVLHRFCADPTQVPITPRAVAEAPLRTPLRSRLRPRPKPRARPRAPRGPRSPVWATALARRAPRPTRAAPTEGPRTPHLEMWDHLRAQPHMAYGLKYCRLSRRVRKILRNRYRYSKYFFMVPPSKRLIITLHL